MNMTIAGVHAEPKPWTDKATGEIKGYFAEGVFDDGSQWSAYAATPEAAGKLIETFTALKDEPGEFTVEPNGEFRGVKKFKMKAWPGKAPAQGGGFRGNGGGGGGRPYVPAYSQSQEAFEIQQRSIQRSVALEHAVKLGMSRGKDDDGTVLRYAQTFYDWLSKPRDIAPATPPATQQTASPADDPHHYKATTNGNGQINLPTEIKPTPEYVKWESEAFTFVAKHRDIWPTWQDAQQFLKPQLLAMGLSTPRTLKECRGEAKFGTLMKALKSRALEVVTASTGDGDMPF